MKACQGNSKWNFYPCLWMPEKSSVKRHLSRKANISIAKSESLSWEIKCGCRGSKIWQKSDFSPRKTKWDIKWGRQELWRGLAENQKSCSSGLNLKFWPKHILLSKWIVPRKAFLQKITVEGRKGCELWPVEAFWLKRHFGWKGILAKWQLTREVIPHHLCCF